MSDLPDELIFYSPADLAMILKLRTDTVQIKLRQGKIPGTKIDRKWYTSKKQLLEYVSENGIKLSGSPQIPRKKHL